MAVGFPEFVENPENRCPVILLLDTSGSMSGQPIQELNRGLAAFKEDVVKDSQASLSVEVAVITFGPIVKLIQDFVTIDQFTPPTIDRTITIWQLASSNNTTTSLPIKPTQVTDRGSRRLITGQNNEIYYTADRYNSFQEVI